MRIDFGTWSHRILVWIGITTSGVSFLFPQDSLQQSTPSLIRQGWGSIAEDACGKLRPVQSKTASLSIIAASNVSLAENAFLAALQKKGFETFVRRDRAPSDVLVTVDVLTDDVAFVQLRQDSFARSVHLEAEVRAEYPGDTPAEILGTFKRVVQDTVAHKDDSAALHGVGMAGGGESSLVQRIVAPLVILGSSILVVYLFFTVRS